MFRNYKEILALNNLKWLMNHKTKPNQTKNKQLEIQSAYPKPNRFKAAHVRSHEMYQINEILSIYSEFNVKGM